MHNAYSCGNTPMFLFLNDTRVCSVNHSRLTKVISSNIVFTGISIEVFTDILLTFDALALLVVKRHEKILS